MNIITYNVRGLEKGVKWATIRRLVKKESADMICNNHKTCMIVTKITWAMFDFVFGNVFFL